MSDLSTTSSDPISALLGRSGVMILDGGLATALEAHGADLNDALWSARVLLDDPDLVREVHLEYLRAGADCIATVTYQATLQGFEAAGLSGSEAVGLFERAVQLAVEARDVFWTDATNRAGRQFPLIAGSIGPYGAFLADGSEYSGQYGVEAEFLLDFHRERWGLLARSAVDVMACETIPSLPETEALIQLLDKHPGKSGWVSFSCRDTTRLCDGSALGEAVRLCDDAKGVSAIGVNCFPPERALDLIRSIRRETDKPILVYPNSGERYHPQTKDWHGDIARSTWVSDARDWLECGARGIGGCCRVGPRMIASLRDAIAGKGSRE